VKISIQGQGDSHSKAELSQALDRKTNEMVSTYAVQEVAPQVAVVAASLQDVIDDQQQPVGDGHQAPFAASAPHQVVGVGLEIAVLLVTRSPGRLH
jgi:hypothetical protein